MIKHDVALLIFILSEAKFPTNKTRSLLDLNTVNMLVCLQDWCRWNWSSNFQCISITLNWLVIPLSLVKLSNLCSLF